MVSNIENNKKSFSISVKDITLAKNKTLLFVIDEFVELPPDLCKLTDNVRGEIELRRQNKILIVTGNLCADLLLTCDRCLEEYKYKASFDIDEALEIINNQELPTSLELDYDKCYETVSEDQKIDITDLIRQYIILDLPLKKICKETCEGLQCEYTKKDKDSDFDLDPRWKSLIDVKNKLE